ncbi:MAG: type I restriction-modification system endonuclease, partial [Planctomycetes bacterium]|nr:type I restriction-modification system endonuclease [Planctomycetota bacterium]
MTEKQELAGASPNFGMLKGFGPALVEAAVAAERYVLDDPVTALMRLRQFGELLAQEAGARVGLFTSPDEGQRELLLRLADNRVLTREVASLFHDLRRKGNDAIHSHVGSRSEALHQLRMARKLAVWFVRGIGGKPNLKVGSFVPPPSRGDEEEVVQKELARLRGELAQAQDEAKRAAESAEFEAALRAEAEVRQKQAYDELETALELAQQTEEDALAAKVAAEAEMQRHLQEVQAAAAQAPRERIEELVQSAQDAGSVDQLDLDEAATRRLIDVELRDAGWEADSESLTFAGGARPAKSVNRAIAEWPTRNGPADYVLFVGMTPVAVVEAKRKRKDVSAAIEQSKRYSRGYQPASGETMPGEPWGDYKIPFLFATNGRPFLRQLLTKSGVWFLDARRPTNHPQALEAWYTPEGLSGLLAQDHGAAERALETEPTDYLGLRDYQVEAIRAVERGVVDGQREMLLAMATGTGKTRTALGLIYRLIKAKRFRRVLFLVDRTALGEQAEGAFRNVTLENQQALDDIYDIQGLGDLEPDADTRLQIATVQGMVRNVLYPDDDTKPIPVDRYDCVIVDESHRGYNLDRDMSEGELEFRSERDYVSKYRRVLDHFDAVKIGLTATPALHTTEIFGKPVFEYSYRQAVIDGYLVDHEPPIRINTELNTQGIHWQVGEEVAVYRGGNEQLELFNTPDEINIDVEGVNTKVVTEN